MSYLRDLIEQADAPAKARMTEMMGADVLAFKVDGVCKYEITMASGAISLLADML